MAHSKTRFVCLFVCMMHNLHFSYSANIFQTMQMCCLWIRSWKSFWFELCREIEAKTIKCVLSYRRHQSMHPQWYFVFDFGFFLLFVLSFSMNGLVFDWDLAWATFVLCRFLFMSVNFVCIWHHTVMWGKCIESAQKQSNLL